MGAAADRVRNRSVPGLMERLRGLSGAVKGAAAIAAITAYAGISDAIATANGQLRLATKTQAQLNTAQAQSYAIAQKQGVAYGAMATLMAKATKSATAMGNGMEEAMRLGEGATASIAAGIKASGTNSQAASAGVFQLSQALASGVLRGDELNSVMENIPAVGDAIAKAMGRSAGELRAMGKEGELTSKAVIEALNKARPELEKLAAMIPLTFGAAFQKVKNSAARLLTGMDQEGVGFGGALIASMDLLSKGLDFLGNHIEVVSNVMVGLLVAAAIKAVAGHVAAAAAARAQAAQNARLAASALAVASAQRVQAASSLAVARAMAAQGVSGGGAAVGQAAANLAAATRQLAAARTAAAGANAALAGATARAGLFGTVVVRAAGIARAALALIGGPIGVAIAALVGLTLWAGKAALGFKPIAGEAGTTADYIAVAFEDATKWAGEKFAQLSTWAGKKMKELAGYVRPVVVWIVDAFLNTARAVAGSVQGIVAAWQAGVGNIRRFISGLASDAAQAMQGNFTTAGTTAALAGAVNIGQAYGRGVQEGFASTFQGVSGETVVKGVEDFAASIPGRIEDFAKRSGWRDRANARALARARRTAGGAQDPGSPVAPAGKDDPKKKEKEGGQERTFKEILDEAKEQAHLASLTTNEAEKQSAIFGAQRDLKRELTALEKGQLTDAIQLRQNNAANLALTEATRDAQQELVKARMTAAAEDARMAGDYVAAAHIEAELKVQELLNQAKRDGVTLDQAKVQAYREAVTLAARETEVIRLQQEAKQALQAIADNARKSIQSAVADGIYAALSGDIKGVKGFFKTVASILRRQLAETITHNLFAGQQQAKIDSLRVTNAAVAIAEPAATAVTQAGQNIVGAMNQAANTIAAGAAGPALTMEQRANQFASTMAQAIPEVDGSLSSLTNTVASHVGPLGGALSSLLGLFSGKGGGGAGGLASGISGLLSPSGPLGGLMNKFAGLVGTKVTDAERASASAAGRAVPTAGSKLMGKLGNGAMMGQMGGSLVGMLGMKSSNTGAMLGGMAASLIPGIGPILGPLLGGALGGALGGMLKKAKTGSVGITAEGVGGATGSSGAFRKAATASGDSVMSQLNQYAKALGTTVQSFGKITLGVRDGMYRVNETGTSLKTKKGAKDFGEDAAAAVAYAVEVAIKRGAFDGLAPGIAAAIKSGMATVEEAVDFLGVQKKIKRQALALVDPVAAAVAEVDDEFGAMLEQYKKFGQDTSDLTKVYLDQRQKAITEAQKNELGVLRDLASELRGGSLGGAALDTRVEEQDRLFKAIEAAQAAGTKVDYAQLNTVGRALIDATRELEGNNPAFQATVARVMTALEAAIAAGENPTVTTLPPPIMSEEALAPVTAGLDNVVHAIYDAFGNLITAVNDQSKAIVRGNEKVAAAAGGGGGGDGGFEVIGRRFELENFR